MDRCFFFGCWKQPGHFLFLPGGGKPSREDLKFEYYGDHISPDATLAPRRMKRTGGDPVWSSKWGREEMSRIDYGSEECPQGEFLIHFLDTGFTAMSWWDRNQGDRRGNCNSTVLLEGRHTAEEMLAALKQHFPHVLENLENAGVKLVDVTPPLPPAA